jgi:IMP dehydrogenase
MRPTPLDADGRLMVACAVGISGEAPEQARRLVETGVSVLVLDTAHGHQRRMLEAIRGVRAAVGNRVPIVAGNVCTAEGTCALLEAPLPHRPVLSRGWPQLCSLHRNKP